ARRFVSPRKAAASKSVENKRRPIAGRTLVRLSPAQSARQLQNARRVGDVLRELIGDDARSRIRQSGARHVEHVEEIDVEAEKYLLFELNRLKRRGIHGPEHGTENVLVLQRVQIGVETGAL